MSKSHTTVHSLPIEIKAHIAGFLCASSLAAPFDANDRDLDVRRYHHQRKTAAAALASLASTDARWNAAVSRWTRWSQVIGIAEESAAPTLYRELVRAVQLRGPSSQSSLQSGGNLAPPRLPSSSSSPTAIRAPPPSPSSTLKALPPTSSGLVAARPLRALARKLSLSSGSLSASPSPSTSNSHTHAAAHHSTEPSSSTSANASSAEHSALYLSAALDELPSLQSLFVGYALLPTLSLSASHHAVWPGRITTLDLQAASFGVHLPSGFPSLISALSTLHTVCLSDFCLCGRTSDLPPPLPASPTVPTSVRAENKPCPLLTALSAAKELRSLSLIDCRSFSPTAWARASSDLPTLEHLSFRRCYGLPQRTLAACVVGFRRTLRHLALCDMALVMPRSGEEGGEVKSVFEGRFERLVMVEGDVKVLAACRGVFGGVRSEEGWRKVRVCCDAAGRGGHEEGGRRTCLWRGAEGGRVVSRLEEVKDEEGRSIEERAKELMGRWAEVDCARRSGRRGEGGWRERVAQWTEDVVVVVMFFLRLFWLMQTH